MKVRAVRHGLARICTDKGKSLALAEDTEATEKSKNNSGSAALKRAGVKAWLSQRTQRPQRYARTIMDNGSAALRRVGDTDNDNFELLILSFE